MQLRFQPTITCSKLDIPPNEGLADSGVFYENLKKL